jgi:hypothetical protein
MPYDALSSPKNIIFFMVIFTVGRAQVISRRNIYEYIITCRLQVIEFIGSTAHRKGKRKKNIWSGLNYQ